MQLLVKWLSWFAFRQQFTLFLVFLIPFSSTGIVCSPCGLLFLLFFSYALYLIGIASPRVSISGDVISHQTLATTSVGIASYSSESIKSCHDLVLRQETANASLPIAVTHSDVSASAGEVPPQVSHLASHHNGQFTHCCVVDLC